jgi:hypothetical protein
MAESETPEPRIDSGSIVFGSDWPGLFLRGDDAFNYSIHLQNLLEVLDEDEASVISVHVIRGLLHDLKSVDIRNTKVERLQLKTARECLMGPPTLPGPAPELNPGTDETWLGNEKE